MFCVRAVVLVWKETPAFLTQRFFASTKVSVDLAAGARAADHRWSDGRLLEVLFFVSVVFRCVVCCLLFVSVCCWVGVHVHRCACVGVCVGACGLVRLPLSLPMSLRVLCTTSLTSRVCSHEFVTVNKQADRSWADLKVRMLPSSLVLSCLVVYCLVFVLSCLVLSCGNLNCVLVALSRVRVQLCCVRGWMRASLNACCACCARLFFRLLTGIFTQQHKKQAGLV